MDEKPIYLKKSQFELKKLKVDKDSLLVDFIEKRQGDKGLVKVIHSVDAPYVAHPDLLNTLEKMRLYVAQQYGYHLLTNDKNDEEYKDILGRITIYGLSVSGAEQLKGAVINGKIKLEAEGTRALPTGRIVFSSEKLGYEQEVQQLVELVEGEVYECLFNNKRAQLDLFDQDGVKEHPAKKKGELVSEAS